MYARKLWWMVAVAALSFGPAAGAQGHAAQEIMAQESPRNWVLDLQFGSYFPSVDEGVVGTPFADVFGDGSLLTQLSLQRLVYQGIGTVGIGLEVGYTEFFGRGFIQGTDDLSGDSTSLRVVPIQLFASYRFDYAALHWDIPFAIYGKAGIGEWIWWSNDGDGETAGDGDASGAKLGFSLAAGLAFHLDWLDPRLSREFDRNFGVNNTYVFVEYTWWNAKFRGNFFEHGLFVTHGLDLSDEIVSGGIAFEF